MMLKKNYIHPSILKAFTDLSLEKKNAIGSISGPQLIIAGPGSGKTYTLVLRTLNILLNGLANPSEIILCTFTEKAALQLKERISLFAKKVGYDGQIQEMHISTIHGLSNDFLSTYRHYTKLGNNFDMLDGMTQKLFIYDNFESIIGTDKDKPYFGKWNADWSAIEGASKYFNKITEELIDPEKLIESDDNFLKGIGKSYVRYEKCLTEYNKCDLSQLQKYFLQILNHPKGGKEILLKIKYVMVDEYQDTNQVQEQIFLKLTSKNKQLCVVGDEDQSLYRFRGATVRNILEFQKLFPECTYSTLVTNYRSHKDIIEAYNQFMSAFDWTSDNPKVKFRYDKEIKPTTDAKFPVYPAVLAIDEQSSTEEAERVAELIQFLKSNNVIKDYNQIAIMMYSVGGENSAHYIDALKRKGIRSFCPRRKAYFDNEEVQLMLACVSLILGYVGENRGDVTKGEMPAIVSMIDSQIEFLKTERSADEPIFKLIAQFDAEIKTLAKGKTLDRRLSDYLYQLFAVEPFKSYLDDENRTRNLSILSQLFTMFQNYYHYTVITSKNLRSLRMKFFNSFLRFLYQEGMNEYEDPSTPFPSGYVQILTIHQSKGLEFPVVIVDSLTSRKVGAIRNSNKELDRLLGPFYAKQPFEPEDRIKDFDRMRLFYVAFSRAEKLLVLSAADEVASYFGKLWEKLLRWPNDKKDLIKMQSFDIKEKEEVKRNFSFTGDLSVYETCPRQYKYFNEYDFAPSRSADVFFGSLVHQTIEEIHRIAIRGEMKTIDKKKITDIFEFNYRQLVNSGMRPIGEAQKKSAFVHITNYFENNKANMKNVKEIEVDVSLDKDAYVLVGKVDLVQDKDNKLEVLDFKSQKKPEDDKDLIEKYRKQLCIYGHILEKRYGRRPDRLVIYWTGEKTKEKARMVFDYDPGVVNAAVQEFDEVVSMIVAGKFEVPKPPEPKYCRECDFRRYCISKGTIKLKE